MRAWGGHARVAVRQVRWNMNNNDNIIGALHSDSKRRLKEAKQKSMKDEADPDELLMSVLGTRYEMVL